MILYIAPFVRLKNELHNYIGESDRDCNSHLLKHSIEIGNGPLLKNNFILSKKGYPEGTIPVERK